MNAQEIISMIAAETGDRAQQIAVLEDGEALAALGITDADQEAVEEAHAILAATLTP